MQAASPLTRLADVGAALAWLRARGATDLATDSRRVRAGDAFIAWPGYAVDGRTHVAQALAAGASACLVEQEGVEAFSFADERVAALPGLKKATGPLASQWFGQPSHELEVLAVTGTNGKTSTAWWTAQALGLLDRGCGVIGTLGVGQPPLADVPGEIESTGLTTPDPVTLQRALRRFASDGLVAAAVEASSIGLDEHRLDGTRITVAQYTNFTQDHLDYHQGMAAYWASKAQLFGWPGLRAAVLNVDDLQGAALARRLAEAGALDVWTYSLYQDARLRSTRLRYRDGGLVFMVQEGGASA
ncbi:MAG: UDP-N-acetylmuramyl-tripeptide synthetase, partial [Rhizobacter sp.]|nr:UDP-N-acetylmuramyl-tripeptide synthetase [Rhizobacter sp.]